MASPRPAWQAADVPRLAPDDALRRLMTVPVVRLATADERGRPHLVAVTFAASTAFMSPVGYQTNLFVYGPGGYDFSDYARVGGPLQMILGIVTTLGIAAFWGI